MVKKLMKMDELRQKIDVINPNITILSTEYKGSSFKLKCECKIHNNIFYMNFADLKRGRGCSLCAKERKRNKFNFSIKDIKIKLKNINSNIEILSKEYINNYTNLKCKCLIHNVKFESTWLSLQKRIGCPECSKESRYNKRKLNLNEIKKRLKNINPNIEIIDDVYINNFTPIKCKCKIDNYEWKAKWNSLLQGAGCPVCGGSLRLTLEEIKNRLKKINPNIEIISDNYENNNTKLLCRCKIDNYEWETIWRYLSQGIGCPECKRINKIGENNPNWNGGVSSLHEYLRTHISQWKIDSFKLYNYKCDITGNTKNMIIHHKYNFSDILQETMEYLNLPIYQEINKYTEKELESIRNKCLELHYKHGLGICLCEEEHKLFHSIYGIKNNTQEQYDRFKIMRLKQQKQSVNY